MVRRFLASTICLAAVAAPTLGLADDGYFGVQVGTFMPTGSKLRDALGDNWLSFGASRIRIFDLNQAKTAFDWTMLSKRADGSSVFIVTGSYGLVTPIGGGNNTRYEPYWAARAGLSYADYAVETGGGRVSGKKIGVNGNVALGLNIDRRVNLEARYDVFNSYDGLSFNGVTLSLSFGIARF